MEKEERNRTFIRFTGLAGLAVGLIMTVSDILLLYAPGGGFNSPGYAWMPGVPFSRMLAGHFLGVFALPLYLIGFLHLYAALKPAGFWRSAGPVGLMAYGTMIGLFYHGSIAYPSLMVQAASSAAPEVRTALTDLVARSRIFSWPAQAVLFAAMAAGSVWFALSVLSGKTLYPRWFAAVNPVLLLLLVAGLGLALPAVGQYLLPAGQSVSMAVYFGISTVLTWNKELGKWNG